MKLKELIKSKLVKTGFDQNESLVENIEKLMAPALEKKAAKLITPGLIKRAVVATLSTTSPSEQEIAPQ